MLYSIYLCQICSVQFLSKVIVWWCLIWTCGCCCCCCSILQMNTLRVTRYVHPHLYMCKCRYTAQGERIACVTVFNYPAMQAVALHLLRVFTGSPFPEHEVCYVRSLPWLKVIPTQQDITTFYCSLIILASINQ